MNHHPAYQKLIHSLNEEIIYVKNIDSCLKHVLDLIGDSRIVLIGEATHGTQEFYETRAKLTQRLITEKGFMAVAIEGDWPDAYYVNRYLNGRIATSDEALKYFKRFPLWMWRNHVVKNFIEWLRLYNDNLSTPKVGFYGLDLYSLYASLDEIIVYLDKHDPVAGKRARSIYGCFDHNNEDGQTYGYLATAGVKEKCVNQVVEQLLELQHNAFEYIKKEDAASEEEYFYIKQNAHVVKNAEQYYRAMFQSHADSWNIRDKHMVETLNTLSIHLENQFRRPAKIVVWAHNSHLGDARATEMTERGEINLGQIIKEQYDTSAISIGFSTYSGTVTAASDWGSPGECKTIQPALPSSYEAIFHELAHPNFLLNLQHGSMAEHYLHTPRLQRAIGVVYRPETERESHYFFARLPYQFDAIIHYDKTHALEPLEIKRIN